jgi:hypothetical protein
MLDLLLLAITLHIAHGHSPVKPALAPPAITAASVVAAEHHGLDPWEMLALLTAENHNRAYDPGQVGMYGKGGEAGLYQLAPMWARHAQRLCNGSEAVEGVSPCLWIVRGERVHYRASEAQKRRGARDLFDPLVNIEAGAITYAELKRWFAIYGKRRGEWDWRARFRCHNGYLYTRGCFRTVRRVLRWEVRLRGQHAIVSTSVRASLAVLAGAMPSQSARVLWLALTVHGREHGAREGRLGALASRYKRSVRKLRSGLVVAEAPDTQGGEQ